MKQGKTIAIQHLCKDKRFKQVYDLAPKIRQQKDLDLYASLMRAIVGQQLSVKAAATIWGRFLDLFESRYPFAEELLKFDDKELRAVGLSYQKAGYIKNIALFAKTNTLDYEKLRRWPDEKLIEYLTQIKGVGRWTVEMILMFNLNRPDVFPKDDLGIQTGMIKIYALKPKTKKELLIKMEKIAEAWRPHRTLACLYVWQHKDNKPQ